MLVVSHAADAHGAKLIANSKVTPYQEKDIIDSSQ
jgi:hypothetical protein